MNKKRTYSKKFSTCQPMVSRGFTLIELIIVLAIVAIGLALAAPSYQDIIERRHTTSKAETLAAFMGYARSEVVKSNKQVSVTLVRTSANEWCIGITDLNTACDCKADSTQCVINGVEKTLSSATQTRLGMTSMTAASADTTFVFDPVRGTKIAADLADHSYDFQSDNGNWEIRVIVGPTGRVRLCNSDSSKKISGYHLCVNPVFL